MMTKNYDELVEINLNPKWPYISDHPYRILISGGSGSGKTNVLLNLIKHQRSYIRIKASIAYQWKRKSRD